MEELLNKIEGYGFECQGGPLIQCQDWLKLRVSVLLALSTPSVEPPSEVPIYIDGVIEAAATYGRMPNPATERSLRVAKESLRAALSTPSAPARVCKLTECQGKPRCKMCLAMDASYPSAPAEPDKWQLVPEGADSGDAERYRRLAWLVEFGTWFVGTREPNRDMDTYLDDKADMDATLDSPAVVDDAAGWRRRTKG